MHVVLQCNTRTYIYGEIQFCYLFWHVTFSKFCHFLVDKFIISWGQHENIRDSRHARLSKKKGMLPWKNSIHKKFLSFFGLGLILIYLLDIKILSETSSTVISALSSIYICTMVVFFLFPSGSRKTCWTGFYCVVIMIVYAQWEEEEVDE